MSGDVPHVSPDQNWGWPYQILPYIEQQNLWEQTVDADVFKTPVSIYFCPTRRGPMVFGNPPRAMMDYAGNAGTDTTGNNNKVCR